MHKGASLAICAMVLGSMKLLTELCLVVLGYVDAILQLVPSMSKRALEFKINRSKVIQLIKFVVKSNFSNFERNLKSSYFNQVLLMNVKIKL